MRLRNFALRLSLPTLLLTILAWAPSSHAIPALTVDFTAKPQSGTPLLSGAFSFEYSDGAAEFGRPACITCDLTAFSFTDSSGHAWSSTGVGNGGVNAFSLVFGATGNIASWSFGLDNFSVPCTLKLTNCTGTVSTTLNSTAYGQTTTYAWPELQLCKDGVCTIRQEAGSESRLTRPFTVSYAAVPEPSSLALLGLGLGILPRLRRGFRRRSITA